AIPRAGVLAGRTGRAPPFDQSPARVRGPRDVGRPVLVAYDAVSRRVCGFQPRHHHCRPAGLLGLRENIGEPRALLLAKASGSRHADQESPVMAKSQRPRRPKTQGVVPTPKKPVPMQRVTASSVLASRGPKGRWPDVTLNP